LASVSFGAALAFGGCGSSGDGGGGSGDDASPGSSGGGSGGSGGSSSAACPIPADVSGWLPPEYRHAKTGQSCTAAQIAAYANACAAGGVTSGPCTDWRAAAANLDCVSCLESSAAQDTWGPVVRFGGVVSGNAAGCIELTDPANTACPSATQAWLLCEHQACDPVCPVTDAASFDLWRSCAQTANGDQSLCGTYAAGAVCAQIDSGPSAVCDLWSYASLADFVRAVAPVFCLAPYSDAGSDASGGGMDAAPPLDSGGGDSPATADATPDAPAPGDATAEASVDAGTDATVDAGADAQVDSAVDAIVEAALDVVSAEAGAETGPDSAADATSEAAADAPADTRGE
jgi:hypothetical protein